MDAERLIKKQETKKEVVGYKNRRACMKSNMREEGKNIINIIFFYTYNIIKR